MRAMKNRLRNGIFLKTYKDPHMILFKYHMQSRRVNTSLPPPFPAFVAHTDSRGDFHKRLAALRKERGLTQQALADRVECHVQQLKRYEAGSSQPTLDVIRNLATALSVTSDRLLFGKDERGPDDDLRLQFEAVSRFDPEEKQVVRSVLEGMILKHEARRWQNVSNGERK
jgi:transcriptional regulator with XRE-family HTH domain